MDLERALDLLKTAGRLRKDATTAGITTATGLVAYNLEPQAKTIYPVLYPFLASVPRVGPEVAGTANTGVHWKAITATGAGYYIGISEGNRNANNPISEKDYFAPFKYIGVNDQVTMQAQRAGQGFDDNLALAQITALNTLLNQEDQMLFFGNSGSSSNAGYNGFQLRDNPDAGGHVVHRRRHHDRHERLGLLHRPDRLGRNCCTRSHRQWSRLCRGSRLPAPPSHARRRTGRRT